MMRALSGGAVWCLLAFLSLWSAGDLVRAAPANQLVFVTATGRHSIEVEVASTQAERARGLMYRRSLEADRGMIFDFAAETDVSMWMQNTYISLDMVFVRSDGVVHRVERDTTPFSERIISAGAPVRFVVEVAAGTAKRLGIERGDRVEHALIKP